LAAIVVLIYKNSAKYIFTICFWGPPKVNSRNTLKFTQILLNKASPPQAAAYLPRAYLNLIAASCGELDPNEIKGFDGLPA
jgi:hypothetical protein